MAGSNSTPNWRIDDLGCLIASSDDGQTITLIADEHAVKAFLAEHYDRCTQKLVGLDDNLAGTLAKLGMTPEEDAQLMEYLTGGDATDAPAKGSRHG